MSERVAAIVNPIAGGGRARHVWQALAPALEAQGLEAGVSWTGAPGEARHLARQALEAGATLVIAVGGDGTAHEVVNGFWEAGCPEAARLALVPAGSGNDFARSLTLPHTPEAWAALAASGRVRRIDVGLAAFTGPEGQPVQRAFLNTFSVGIGVAALETFQRFPPLLRRAAGYSLAGLGQLGRYRAAPVRLVRDGGPPVEVVATWVVVGNGAYFGGGMPGFPQADPGDGRLDLMVVGEGGFLSRLGFMAALRRGRHGGHWAVSNQRFETLRLETPAPIEIDGELAGRGPATLTVRAGALRMVTE